MKVSDEAVLAHPLHDDRAGLITLSPYLVAAGQILKGV